MDKGTQQPKPDALDSQAKERAYLVEAQKLPFLKRMRAYLRLSGPGFLQSAMTLGAGTAGACLLAGSKYGYQLLWVQPIAMILGLIMLAAIAKQTVSTGERPYQVFWKRLHPSLAILWAVSALLATIIWHIPQYSLGTNAIQDILQAFGTGKPNPWWIAVPLLILAVYITWNYDKGLRGIRIYELTVKALVWGIVLTFAIVAFASGIRWGEVLKGFFGFYIPFNDPKGLTILIGTLGAVVGINMVFLYPYSLLKRNWGREYEGLAYFDLILGMAIPFILATTFVIIGTANTLGRSGIEAKSIMNITPLLSPALGLQLSALILGLGLLAIAFSTITTHMLVAGFICCEMLNIPTQGWRYRLLSLIPAVGIVGAAYPLPFWAAVLASSFAVILMPVALICFWILHNSASYLGEALPRGCKRWLWNIGLALAIGIITIAGVVKLGSQFKGKQQPTPAAQEKVLVK
ncbi:MAG: divalent metal cation transporter [candidate division KSB1 bacterium]|nr:divalent metal cation transporter [candidate division KSB1 bacterium]